MTFDCRAWLERTVKTRDFMHNEVEMPMHQRICFLVFANSGFRVSSWGSIWSYRGHQKGLEQNDALDLMTITAYMDGLQAAGVQIHEALKPHFDAYIAALEAENPEVPR